jgi:hypothetical protein
MCSEFITFTLDIEQCVAGDLSRYPADCTVGVFEACADSTGGDPCARTQTSTPECQAFEETCSPGGS